jgi:hypothetical protein
VRHTYFVPVRMSKDGTLALQTGRLGSGERVGLAFTSESSLALTLGPSQQWTRLDLEALMEMLAPLGVEHVRVDPHRVGPSDGQPVPAQADGSSPAPAGHGTNLSGAA